MTRFIMPTILIAISIAIFFAFTNPIFDDISAQKATLKSYNDALDNDKALENQRDILTAKENAINPDNLVKIQKLIPENVDNIRLILEIGKIASPYGMVLKNVQYSVTTKKDTTAASGTPAATVQGGGAASTAQKNYGIFELGFSVTGSYDNFINFTKDLESNLRIVDISSVQFSSDTTSTATNVKTNSSEIYTYNFRIRTYWLKN